MTTYPSKKPAAGIPDADTAAAIALALGLELQGCSDEEAAAIALALHLYTDDGVHDRESGVITIEHRPSAWDFKFRNFRKTPRK